MASNMSNVSEDLKSGALVYHRLPRPGKLEIKATKPLGNQRDLALAYSPGVRRGVCGHQGRPAPGSRTDHPRQSRGRGLQRNAVLGLGIIGPLASKPVMEGKPSSSRSSPASTCSTSRSPAHEVDTL